jgi:hypothetical protein
MYYGTELPTFQNHMLYPYPEDEGSKFLQIVSNQLHSAIAHMATI